MTLLTNQLQNISEINKLVSTLHIQLFSAYAHCIDVTNIEAGMPTTLKNNQVIVNISQT
jgi:hypothetical protein